MFNHMFRSRFVSSWTLLAITAGLAGCSDTDPGSNSTVVEGQASIAPAPWEPPGLPQYLKAPHARTTDDGQAAKLASGYHYAQGQLADSMSYGIYTYIDSTWTYVSTSVWSTDGSSISNGTDLSSTGEVWNQTGSYFVQDDGTTTGDYFTSYIDENRVGTLYLTDYEATATSATYRSTIDYTNTDSAPDCDYLSEWQSDASSSFQMCTRADQSWWACDYAYNYVPTVEDGVTVSVQYLSTQTCIDSRTDFDPDYTYEDDMSWDYVTGDYVDVAHMMCHESDGTQRTFTYTYQDGVGTWTDESQAVVDGPSCGWSQET